METYLDRWIVRRNRQPFAHRSGAMSASMHWSSPKRQIHGGCQNERTCPGRPSGPIQEAHKRSADSLVRVHSRFWGNPRGHGCPRSFLTPPCPPTRRMRIWFATAALPDYGWAANDEPLVALKL